MKKACVLALICMLTLTQLVGCSPAVRLEERLIIRGMAVDFDEDYIITVQSYHSTEEGGEEFDLITAREKAFMRLLAD